MQTSFFWSKFDIQSAGVSLKIRSRSPKSNDFFPMSQWCFYASLVEIHQLGQEIEAHVYNAHVYSFYCVMTLKIRSWSLKSNQIFKLS